MGRQLEWLPDAYQFVLRRLSDKEERTGLIDRLLRLAANPQVHNIVSRSPDGDTWVEIGALTVILDLDNGTIFVVSMRRSGN